MLLQNQHPRPLTGPHPDTTSASASASVNQGRNAATNPAGKRRGLSCRSVHTCNVSPSKTSSPSARSIRCITPNRTPAKHVNETSMFNTSSYRAGRRYRSRASITGKIYPPSHNTSTGCPNARKNSPRAASMKSKYRL